MPLLSLESIMNAENAEIFDNPLGKGLREEKVLFAYFLALPRKLRNREIQTQNQFSDMYGVDITTLSRWKKQDRIQKLRHSFMEKFLENKTADVLSNLYTAATYNKDGKADVQAIRLWLEFFDESFGSKKKKEKFGKIDVIFPEI